jgi:hypothetical protein
MESVAFLKTPRIPWISSKYACHCELSVFACPVAGNVL